MILKTILLILIVANLIGVIISFVNIYRYNTNGQNAYLKGYSDGCDWYKNKIDEILKNTKS